MAVTLHTSLGDIKVELFCDQVPRTAKNFLALAASGKYDDSGFHRVIRGFVAQGGSPGNSGKGGESIYGKYFDDEIVETLRHDKRGMLSMANKGPNKNGSQFFITLDKATHLNNVNTVFGRVLHGFPVLDALELVEVGDKDKPVTPVTIRSVTIHANPFAEKETG